MKKVLLIFSLILISLNANAKDKFLFWYPGEAGSTSQASGIMDLFCEELGQENNNKVSCTYHNTLVEGKTFVKRELPLLGILSFPTWERYKNYIPNAKIERVIISPQNQNNYEYYTLWGKKGSPSENSKIYMSEPLESSFVRNKLFPTLPKNIHFVQSKQLLKKLRELALSTENAWVLLKPSESFVFEKITRDWKKQLSFQKKSQAILPPVLINFAPHKKESKELLEAFEKFTSKEKNKEILNEMRIKKIAKLKQTEAKTGTLNSD